jgi:hypothetical protein
MKQNRLICSRLRLLTTFLPPLERQCISLRRFTATREACLSNIFAVFPIFQIDSPATPNYCLAQTAKLRVRCEDTKMCKRKTKKPCELIETEEFSVSWTLIGDPSRADGRLEELLHHIATEPESFPVVDWPNTRMALTTDLDGSIGIFFRRMPNSQRIELLRSQVKNAN